MKPLLRSLALLVLVTLTACQQSSGSTPTQPSATTPAPATDSPASTDELVIDGLDVTLVTDRVAVPREVITVDDRSLVLDQLGAVWVLEDGKVGKKPFLDIRSEVLQPSGEALELGLAGLALAPDFAESGVLYTFSTAPPRKSDDAEVERIDVITRWRADPETLVLDQKSAQEIWSYPRTFLDHVGGELVFDDDGLLHAAVGAETSSEEAQDPNSFAGSILRFDPEDEKPEPEVFSYGYRNPFRMTWDAEVGLVVSEPMFTEKDSQVSVPEPGGNAGYPLLSGELDSCWADGGGLDPRCEKTESGEPLVPPVLEYPRDIGQIVSGAFIYRSERIPELTGKAIVADWYGTLMVASPGEAPWAYRIWQPPAQDLAPSSLLWDIGTDDHGIVYLMRVEQGMQEGQLYAIDRRS